MDFAERWFGISPDGGNGAFEASLILCATVIIVGVVCLARLVRRIQARRDRLARTES
jgi:hypothetical protein